MRLDYPVFYERESTRKEKMVSTKNSEQGKQAAGILVLEGEPGSLMVDREVAGFLDATFPGGRDGEVRRFSGLVDSPESIIDEISFCPMIQEPRVLLLAFFDKLHESVRKEILEWLGSLDEEMGVILVAEKYTRAEAAQMKKIHGLERKKIKKLWSSDLNSLIREWARSTGCSVAPEAARIIVDALENHPGMIFGELDKMSTAVGPERKITGKVVRTHLSGAGNPSIFKLCEQVGNRNLTGAMNTLDALLDAGESGPGIIVFLNRHFKILTLASTERAVSNGWKEKARIGGILGVSPYFALTYLDQSRNFTKREYPLIFQKLLDADYALKTGARTTRLTLDFLLHGIIGNI